MIRLTGKNLEEAVTRGLAELGITREQAEIRVIEEGSKGLFGIGSREAVIEIGKKASVSPESVAQELFGSDESYEKACDFLREMLERMEIKDAKFSRMKSETSVTIQIDTLEAGIIIGKRGQTLNAIQYLLNIFLNRGQEDKTFYNLDIADYRSSRERSLQDLSKKLAQKVNERGKNIELEPMTSRERRIIHMALKNHPQVTTFSKGEEPYRKVVISLKNKRHQRRYSNREE
ncbi:MAG: protein jag [Candidatus Wallbacteria bacterium]|nr:protein jag [Candidatus Wallbacteria bacterium]